MSHSLLRRAPMFLWLATVLMLSPLWAQESVPPAMPGMPETALATAQSALDAPREGTPTFLGALDSTLQTWSRYFRGWGPYLLLAVALFSAYLIGLAVYQLAFGMGSFAPKAGALGAWFSAMILLFFGLMMLPRGWPWWSPYVLVVFGISLTAVLVSTLSKKAV